MRLERRVALLARLAVGQVGGEGGGGALGDLVEEGVALHRALGGGGEAAGLVERHPLQVEVQGDVLGRRVVDGGIPILTDVLTQPFGREGLGAFGCGLGEGRLRRGGWLGRRWLRRRRLLGLTLVPEPALLLAEVEAGGLRSQWKCQRKTQEGKQRGTHGSDGASRSTTPPPRKGLTHGALLRGCRLPLPRRRRTRRYGLSSLSQGPHRSSATAAMA